MAHIGRKSAGCPALARPVRRWCTGSRCSLFEGRPALRWRSNAIASSGRPESARLLQRIGEGNKRGLLAIHPVTIKTIVVANDRFGAPRANNEWLAAVPTGLQASLREIR